MNDNADPVTLPEKPCKKGMSSKYTGYRDATRKAIRAKMANEFSVADLAKTMNQKTGKEKRRLGIELAVLCKSGEIERISRGIYRTAEIPENSAPPPHTVDDKNSDLEGLENRIEDVISAEMAFHKELAYFFNELRSIQEEVKALNISLRKIFRLD